MPRPRKGKKPAKATKEVNPYEGMTYSEFMPERVEPMPEPVRAGEASEFMGQIMGGTAPKRGARIEMKQAKVNFEYLKETNPKAYKKDKCTTSKRVLKRGPTEAWNANMGSADVPGIDAPGKCTTKTVKGEKVTTCTIPKGAKYAPICKPKPAKKGKGKKK